MTGAQSASTQTGCCSSQSLRMDVMESVGGALRDKLCG